MANTTFVDQNTVVVASWLNDVNDVVYDVLGNGTTVPITKTEVKDNLGVVSRTTATGSAVLPVGTTAQRDGSPLAGFLRYNSTTLKFEGYTGTAWGSIGGGGATGGGGDEVFIENSRTVTASYTLTTGKNAHAVGPLTFNAGTSVTVPAGARFIIF